MDARILLVEDDDDLRAAMAEALEADGHRVHPVRDGRSALEAAAAVEHDVVLLDVALGAGPDGVEVCRRIRGSDAEVYVIMLTARDTEADVVLALEAGADDYVTKPVGVAELRSRVRAALRRLRRTGTRESDGEPVSFRHEALVLDRAARSAAVGMKTLELTRSELAVLESLLGAGGAVQSRAQLLQAIYGDDAYRDPHAIDVHVHHLRDKVGRAGGDPGWIVTVRGVGYRMGR